MSQDPYQSRQFRSGAGHTRRMSSGMSDSLQVTSDSPTHQGQPLTTFTTKQSHHHHHRASDHVDSYRTQTRNRTGTRSVTANGAMPSRPGTSGISVPEHVRNQLPRGRDSPELKKPTMFTHGYSEHGKVEPRRLTDPAGSSPPSKQRVGPFRDLPELSPTIRPSAVRLGTANLDAAGHSRDLMRKSLPTGLMESELAARKMRSAAAGSRSPGKTALPSAATTRPRRPSGLSGLRSFSDKGLRPLPEAHAEPEWPLEDSSDAESPKESPDAEEAPYRPWGHDLYFPDEDRKPPKFDSSCAAGSNSTVVRCGAVSMGGRHRGTWKKENQDQYTMQAGPKDKWAAMGVFDGHGANGLLVSGAVKALVAKHLHGSSQGPLDRSKPLPPNITEVVKSIFSEVTMELRLKSTAINMMSSGTCALLCLVSDSILITGWLGDSRAVLGSCWNWSQNLWIAKALSKDHKPEDAKERKRIIASNGRVDRMVVDCRGTRAGPYRVYLRYDHQPGLAVSRAFGDLLAQEAGVICVPDVTEHALDNARDMFIVLASDGVWELMSDQEVVQIVGSYIMAQKEPLHETVATTASALVAKEAQRRWYVQHKGAACDDITVVTTFLCHQMSRFSAAGATSSAD